jgi:hypothetical protein
MEPTEPHRPTIIQDFIVGVLMGAVLVLFFFAWAIDIVSSHPVTGPEYRAILAGEHVD